MSDPLSMAAGVVGITAFAIDSIQSLIAFSRGIQQAPKTVEQLRSDLDGVENAISALTKAFTDGASSNGQLKRIVTDIKLADMVNNCGDSCQAFQATLEKWTRHTTPSRTSKRDRLRIAFETDAIESFHGQLNACKQTLDIAINTSILLAQDHQINMTDKIDTILQDQEKNMLQLIKATETQVERSRMIEAQLQAMKEEGESRAERQDIQEIIEFIADERKACDHYTTACEWVYKQAQSKRTGVSIEDVKVTESAFASMGVTNVDAKALKDVDLRIDIQKVSVDGKAMAFMGYQKFDTNALFSSLREEGR